MSSIGDGAGHRCPDISPVKALGSWKEIASYLGRTVRTVQRWERNEGLPVRRLNHRKRGSVVASREELDRWWNARTSKRLPESDPAPARSVRWRKTFALVFLATLGLGIWWIAIAARTL